MKLLLFFIFCSIFYFRCGVPGVITGGLKDTISPILGRASILQKATNVSVKEKNIKFYFNEFIQIANPSNISINPNFKEPLTVLFNRRKIDIKLDSMKKNTTYVLDFENTIADLNENNQYKNFKWIFSTGPQIDTLKIKGIIINAETNEPDTSVNAILHIYINDTVATYNKPEYIIKPNGKGEFEFTYLKSQPYLLFALENAKMDGYYVNTDLKIGFIEKVIYPDSIDSFYTIRIFQTTKKDAQKTSLKYEKDKPILEYTTNLKDSVIDLKRALKLKLNLPIYKFNPEEIFICDSTTTECFDISNKISYDTLTHTIAINYNWLPDTSYSILIQKGFCTDTNLFVKDDDTLLIKTLPISKYGQANIIFENSKHIKKPVMRIMSNKEIIATISLLGGKIKSPFLKSGKYTVDIFDDEFNNGEWDTGNYKQKKQPEHIYKLKNDLDIIENNFTEYKVIFK